MTTSMNVSVSPVAITIRSASDVWDNTGEVFKAIDIDAKAYVDLAVSTDNLDHLFAVFDLAHADHKSAGSKSDKKTVGERWTLLAKRFQHFSRKDYEMSLSFPHIATATGSVTLTPIAEVNKAAKERAAQEKVERDQAATDHELRQRQRKLEQLSATTPSDLYSMVVHAASASGASLVDVASLLFAGFSDSERSVFFQRIVEHEGFDVETQLASATKAMSAKRASGTKATKATKATIAKAA